MLFRSVAQVRVALNAMFTPIRLNDAQGLISMEMKLGEITSTRTYII